MVLAGIFTLSPAISSLMNKVAINSFGQIPTTTVWAKSGYWRDIQDAVNQAATYGIANVRIPEGTFNFVNVSERWTGGKVTIPEGVNIFGAPTQRTSGLPYDDVGMNPNDQVVEWKTVLVMPWDAGGANPESPTWFFRYTGTGDPTKPTRISDIKFVGYREIDPTCTSWHGGIRLNNVVNYRIDHCFFKHCSGGGIFPYASANAKNYGLIDHCRLVNDYGYVEWWVYDCTVAYGIGARAATGGTPTRWEDDITEILGKYTDYTLVVEDCYFSRWRHCITMNDGLHLIFRHNTIEKDSVVGSLDGHGSIATNYVGTRAMEIYNNILIDPIYNFGAQNWDSTRPLEYGDHGFAVNWRGGGGVYFNNYANDYKYGIYLTDEGEIQKCYPHDVWIWNNTWVNIEYPTSVGYQGHYHITQNVDYFLRAPNQEQDGFEYTPYPYPHPLTIPQS